MDALGGVVGDQLGRGVVGVQLNLVDGGDNLGAGVVQELLKVLDTKVGDTNVLNLAGGGELLHLLPVFVIRSSPIVGLVRKNIPGLDEVPVRKVLLQVVGVSRAGPVDQVKVDIVETKALERRVNSLRHTVVPGVVELSGNPDLLTGNARVTDTVTNLGLVAVSQSTAAC